MYNYRVQTKEKDDYITITIFKESAKTKVVKKSNINFSRKVLDQKRYKVFDQAIEILLNKLASEE